MTFGSQGKGWRKGTKRKVTFKNKRGEKGGESERDKVTERRERRRRGKL
jgi:hypothetical protein